MWRNNDRPSHCYTVTSFHCFSTTKLSQALEKYYQHYGEILSTLGAILSAFTGNHRFTPWHNFNPFNISNVTSCIKNLVHKSIGATYLFLKAAIFDTVSWSNDQCVLRGEPQQVWCKWGNSLTGEHTKRNTREIPTNTKSINMKEQIIWSSVSQHI